MRVVQLFFAAVLGFASVVEWSHMKHAMETGNHLYVVTTAIAAVATGFMAAEALRGEWPSW